MPAASTSNDPQPSSSGTQPNPHLPPTTTVEEEEDDNDQDPPVQGDEDDNDQDNNPLPPPPPNTTTEEPDSSTQLPLLPDEVAALAKVLGKAMSHRPFRFRPTSIVERITEFTDNEGTSPRAVCFG